MAVKVLALAGGVGGAKLVDGLNSLGEALELEVVVNTGDDFEHLGLRICPDLDTVCYTLGGLIDPQRGWGRAGESWRFLEALEALGGPGWFRLGDLDLALHAERTRLLGCGMTLSAVTARLSRRLGITVPLRPMADEPAPTIVVTEAGRLGFQEYFVARSWQPRVLGFEYCGEGAAPAAGVLEAIQAADLVVLCPSNPFVSIAPILSLHGVRAALMEKVVVAISPLVDGQALRGPAAKMFAELGQRSSVLGVAEYYGELLSGIVIDAADAAAVDEIKGKGMAVRITDTIMSSLPTKQRLAQETIHFAGGLLR